MTREEAVIILANFKRYISGGGAIDRSANEAINMAIEALSLLEPHWIPVTDGLPKKCNTTYLATVDYGEHGMAVGQRFFFGDNIGWNDKSVVAWMPLPEPYKGVTE